MINLDKAKKVFLEYTNNYDKEKGMIDEKISHTLRVMKTSEIIAKELGISKEEIELAVLIGILHDIGRFEQAKQTNSYLDNSKIDHADMGVKILFEDNKIREFLPDDTRYDNIIELAVKNHNKLKITEGISVKEKLFCEIIRDADKLDNLSTFITEDIEERGRYNCLDVETDEITKEVLESFYNNEQIPVKYIETVLDLSMKVIAFIFDINFNISFKIINEKDYINKIVDRLEDIKPSQKNKLENVREEAIRYIQKALS